MDSRLPFSVADPHLAEDLFQGGLPLGKERVQQRADIGTTQQRPGLLMKQTFFQQEQHGHHDQGQVMVPAPPTANWIVAQANVLFALLQGPFDPIALPPHEGQAGRRRVRRGVAEAIFELGRRVDLPAHDQMPWAGLGLFAIPQPHPPVRKLHPQRAFRVIAHRDGPPCLRRLPLRPLVNPYRRGVSLKTVR